jgi:hypothetical protein
VHRCFSTVIAPLLGPLAPRTVIEVGCGSGRLTSRLLASDAAHTAVVHAVDPAPEFHPADLTTDPARLVVHAVDSLSAITSIGAADLAILDGDPNHHTVHAELTLLTRLSREAGSPPPAIVVHHVHWPFGRRDGYHRPELIPAAALHPHSPLGLVPGQQAPAADGLALAPFVADHEYGEGNGVLTAVEDFVAGDAETWELVDLPGYHGAAVLAAASTLAARPSLRGALDELTTARAARRAARRAEAGRIEALLTGAPDPALLPLTGAASPELVEARQERDQVQQLLTVTAEQSHEATTARDAAVEARQRAEATLADIQAELVTARARAVTAEQRAADAAEQRARHDAAMWRVEQLSKDLVARERDWRAAVEQKDGQLRTAVEATVRLQRALEDLDATRSSLTAEQKLAAALRTELTDRDQTLASVRDSEQLLRGRAAHLTDALEATRSEAARAGEAVRSLEEILATARRREEALVRHIRAAADSRAWRLGHRVTRVFRRVTLRPPASSAGALDAALLLAESPLLPNPDDPRQDANLARDARPDGANDVSRSGLA